MTEHINYDRENNSKALLNNDMRALEEHKFKKSVLRNINKMEKTIENLINEVETLKSELNHLKEKQNNTEG